MSVPMCKYRQTNPMSWYFLVTTNFYVMLIYLMKNRNFWGYLLSNPVTCLPVTLFYSSLFFSCYVLIVFKHIHWNDHLSDKIYFCIACKQRFLTNLQFVTPFMLKEKSCLPNIFPTVYCIVCGMSVQPTLDWTMCILFTFIGESILVKE